MSSRKENVYYQGSGTKNIKSRELQRTRNGQVNLNSTFCNVPGPRSIMKHEMSTIFLPAQSSVDYDLQCDIAYSNYLQALISQQYASLQIKKHNLCLNDQLSKNTDILLKKQEIVNELKQEFKETNIRNIEKEFLSILESKLNNNIKKLTPEIESAFDQIIHVLELAYNQLYLKNVKPLESQEEYSHLQELLSKCDRTMSKILHATGNNQKYQNLSQCLIQFLNLKKEHAMVEKSVKTLQTDINKLTLETVSDILYDNKLHTKKDVL